MGYLDDEDHVWELDPASVGITDDRLVEMLQELAPQGPDAILYVLEGYERLRQKLPKASQAECFSTSMIWWFG